jgi:hypothetical protein
LPLQNNIAGFLLNTTYVARPEYGRCWRNSQASEVLTWISSRLVHDPAREDYTGENCGAEDKSGEQWSADGTAVWIGSTGETHHAARRADIPRAYRRGLLAAWSACTPKDPV